MQDSEIYMAYQRVASSFPFSGYMSLEGGAYFNISRQVLKYLPRGAKILDFGAGPCDKTAILQTLGYQCSAFDDLSDDWHNLDGNRAKILEFANNIGMDYHLAPDGFNRFSSCSFDMVMSHDVLEHLHNSPRELLNDLVSLVHPGGYIFLTVPNAVNIRKRINVLFGRTNLPAFASYYWHPGEWRGHIREYVRDDLEKLAEFLNLEVILVRGCDHMLQKVPVGVRGAYTAITGVFDGWKDSWMLIARKPHDWVGRRELHRKEFEQVMATSVGYRYTNE